LFPCSSERIAIVPSLAVLADDRYCEHNAGDGHPESPERLRIIHDLLNTEFRDLPRIEPRLADESELALVHDTYYIDHVAKTAGVPHTQLDADTGMSARSYEIARLAAGGLLNAVDALLSPHPSPLTPHSIFAFVRPPGHHAEADHAMGFCIFNNIAIAAEYAKRKYHLERVLIVDWDLHHGNGTQNAFYRDPHVLFFSSHQFPYYPGSGNMHQSGSAEGEGFTVNAPFPHGFGDAEYLAAYERILVPIALEYKPQLVLVSAGFDPYYNDPLGGMNVTGPGFGSLAALVKHIADETCNGKVLLTLEGGYDPGGLREGVRAVLHALQGERTNAPHAAPSEDAERVIRQIIMHQKTYWKSLR
jgi:acetoin utilization deacetylase AcuC-like enzyme